MADLTLYTMADPELLAGALNGVAMVFDPANTNVWVSDPASSSGFGMGAIAGVGLVITLFVILFKAVMTQKLELGSFFVIIIAYVMAFVPKTTLQVERIQDGQIEVVDGIPYAVAIPAALMSGMFVSVAETFEIAFSDPRMGTYSETGFLDPLKSLAKMRDVTQGAGNSVLKQNMQEYLRYCMVHPGTGTESNFEQDLKRHGGWASIFDTSKLQPGLVELMMPAGSGSYSRGFFSCKNSIGSHSSAADFIKSQITDYTGASSPTGLNNNGLEADLVKMGGRNEIIPGEKVTQIVKNSITTLVGNATVDANVVMSDLVVGSLIRDVGDGYIYTDPDSLLASMSKTEAMERLAVDSAGSGSMFLSTMQQSMDIMLFVWIALAPIVAMTMIVSGIAGIKMLVQYFLFGVWTQSWMPFAMVINYYMQLKLSKTLELKLLTGGNLADIFAPGMQVDLYRELAGTITAGSTLLAYTPILSLAVLSGSYFALSQLGTAMSGKDGYFDEKKMAPDAAAASGGKAVADGLMTQGMSAYQAKDVTMGAQGTLTSHEAKQMGQTALSSSVSSLAGISQVAGEQAQSAAMASYKQAYGTDSSHMQSWSKAIRANYGQGDRFDEARANSTLTSAGVQDLNGLSQDDKVSLLSSLAGTASTGKTISPVALDAALRSDASKSDSYKKALSAINNNQWSAQDNDNFVSSLTQGRSEDFAKQATAQSSEAFKTANESGQTYSQMKKVEDTASKGAQSSGGASSGLSINHSDLAQKLAMSTKDGKMTRMDENASLAAGGTANEGWSTPEGQAALKKYDQIKDQMGGGWKGAVMGAAALMKDSDGTTANAGHQMMASLMDRAGGYSYEDGDAVRNAGEAMGDIQKIGGERLAGGNALKAEAANGMGRIEGAISDGAASIKNDNHGIMTDVSAGQSDEKYNSRKAQLGSMQEASRASTMSEGAGAVSTATGQMRFDMGAAMNDSVPAKGLALADSIGEKMDGFINLAAGRVETDGFFGNGGARERLQQAQNDASTNKAVLSAGTALMTAETLGDKKQAVGDYLTATGSESALPSSSQGIEAMHRELSNDFKFGGKKQAEDGLADAEARIGTESLAVNTFEEMQNRGGRQIDSRMNFAMPGNELLDDQKVRPGEDRENMPLDKSLIDIAKPTKQ